MNAFKDFSVRTVAMDAFQCSDILSDEIKPFLLMQLLGHTIRLLRGISRGERLFKNEGRSQRCNYSCLLAVVFC